MQALLVDTQCRLHMPTCGSIFRLITTVNMLQQRLKIMLHRSTSRINRFSTDNQTIVKLSTIVNIASATIVIVKKALSLSTSYNYILYMF